MNIHMFKKGDIFLLMSIGILICISLCWNYNNLSQTADISRIAVIIHDGKLVAKINLDELQEPEYIRINEGIKVVILAEKGRIRFLESDCPDKICVKTGWLTQKGDKAVCLPSKTIVKIEGEEQVDSIAY